jgi:NADP-dependent aldehyde dehydrogenase
MGSVNPVIILPGALRERCDVFAEGLLQSVTMGVGQFCTNPGLVVGLRDANMSRFVDRMEELIRDAPPATMLHPGILRAYRDGVHRLEKLAGVTVQHSTATPDETKTEAQATVFVTDAETLLKNQELSEELFGPSTVIVECSSRGELTRLVRDLQGHLTATVHGTADDLDEFKDLVYLLQRKVGRIIYNGFPTGVEVCAAMHHGGPYPATTDSRSTSVGTAAIKRFARPISFQDFPQEALPVELKDKNERRIWRIVDNQLTKDDCD